MARLGSGNVVTIEGASAARPPFLRRRRRGLAGLSGGILIPVSSGGGASSGASSGPCTDPLCAYADIAFRRMKDAAEKAGWPPDLTPQIVTLDKTWQWRKSQPFDAAEVRALAERMGAMAQTLNLRASAAAKAAATQPAPAPQGRSVAPVPVPAPTPSAPSPPAPPSPWYTSPWLIGGLAAAGGVGLVVALARSRGRALSGARRRRWRH